MTNSGVSTSVLKGAAGGPARMGTNGAKSGVAGGLTMKEDDGMGLDAVIEMTGAGAGAGGPTMKVDVGAGTGAGATGRTGRAGTEE